VNTNSLAKHYETLTPWERLPLILAASARGDERERCRLAMSAPRMGYRVQDYFGLAQAFLEVSTLHLLELLDLAALYFQAFGLAGGAKGKAGERLLDVALLYGFVFNVTLAGWRLFCAEYSLEPELCWSCLPGYETVQRAEQAAKKAAFTQEGAARYLKRSGREAGQVQTAEDVAASLRECLRARAEWW
jgi:hypothetical protein